VTEHLPDKPSKYEALSLSPNTAKTNKPKNKQKQGYGGGGSRSRPALSCWAQEATTVILGTQKVEIRRITV
jgi:hypothetical protein